MKYKGKQNYFHEFRKSKHLKMQNDFVFVDTETFNIKENDDIEKLYFKLGCVIFWNREKNLITKKSYWYNPTKFWNDLESRFNKQTKSIIFYAHNSYFDFKILNGFQELFKREWFLDSHYIKGTTFMMSFKKKIGLKDYYTLHIWDTMNYVKVPLQELGESVGFPKMKVDFDKVDDKELEIYCKRDTEIIFQFIRNLINFLIVNDLSRLKATIGSLSFSAFRHKFYNPNTCKVFIHNWKRAIKLERESYKGGITDNFRIGKYDDVYKTDINSMYPYVMKEFEIPTKLVFNSSEAKRSQKNLWKIYNKARKKNYACIMKCTIELDKEHAYILESFNKKSLFTYGIFQTSICQAEIDYILTYGNILKIHHLSVYEVHKIFKEFVDFFYDLRVQYQKAKNDVNQNLCKLYLNNLYGKWGQKHIEYEMVKRDSKFFEENKEILMLMFHKKQKLIMENDICYLGTIIDEGEIYVIDKRVFALRHTNKNSKDSFVAISSFITSQARMLLIKYLEVAKRENAYYCDTDSLFLNEIGFKNLVNANYVSEFELGKLKLEGIVKAEFFAPKYYDYVDMKDTGIFENFLKKRKCKGVKKGSILLNENDDKAIYQIDLWQKFKSDLKKGNLSEQLIIKNIKEMNKVYDKGKVDKLGIVEPYHITELSEPICY